jgi:TATA-binding protein-associated factor Taf7
LLKQAQYRASGSSSGYRRKFDQSVTATQEKTVVTKVTQEKKTLVVEKKSEKDEENEEDEEDEQSEHEEKEKKVENHHRHHKHFHPDHWEKHRVPHKKFINQKYVYVYVYESVFVQGYWGFN